MQINWYGEGCFKLVENGTTITVDPVESFTGLTAPRFKTDIVIKTLMDQINPEDDKPIAGNDPDATMGGSEALVIAGPGEYESKGIHITGWPLQKSSSKEVLRSILKIETDDISVGLLGHLADFNDPEILEELGEVDILIIPGGGEPYIKQEAAAKLIRQISPKLVIPSFFKVEGLKRKSDDVSLFLKELGTKTEPVDKISIKKKELGDKMQVCVLTL
jgi:L-ascorbate metabolism protein UlaG (beta-lactamase superfamily)